MLSTADVDSVLQIKIDALSGLEEEQIILTRRKQRAADRRN